MSELNEGIIYPESNKNPNPYAAFSDIFGRPPPPGRIPNGDYSQGVPGPNGLDGRPVFSNSNQNLGYQSPLIPEIPHIPFGQDMYGIQQPQSPTTRGPNVHSTTQPPLAMPGIKNMGRMGSMSPVTGSPNKNPHASDSAQFGRNLPPVPSALLNSPQKLVHVPYPNGTNVPQMPQMPQQQQQSQQSQQPSSPFRPRMSSMPNMPSMPSMPSMPNMSSMTNWTGKSEKFRNLHLNTNIHMDPNRNGDTPSDSPSRFDNYSPAKTNSSSRVGLGLSVANPSDSSPKQRPNLSNAHSISTDSTSSAGSFGTSHTMTSNTSLSNATDSDTDPHPVHRLVNSKSSVELGNKRNELHRPKSHIFAGMRRHNNVQRSVSATGPTSSSSTTNLGRRLLTTKGGRAIPTKSEVGAFARVHSHPTQGGALSTSASSTSVAMSARDDEYRSITPSRKASTATMNSLGSQSTILTSTRHEPLVYPAILSKVAEKFKEQISTIQGERIKNELSYKNAFTGSEAVDAIAYIIKTPDRSLALLLGRSLDAQKLFHDVTYDSRLRDSPSEVYQLTSYDERNSSGPEPNGIFTLLSECYSPTCSRNRLCYSIACPRRLEQQARLNMKLDPGLLLSNQQESSISLIEDENQEEKLWRWKVPKDILEATPPMEQKRQEAIAELVYTERQFVKALEYIRESWIKPLRRSNVLGPDIRRDKFIRMVFLNVLEVHAVNLKFAEALTRRQQLSPVVNQIADVVLEFVPRFDPFVTYGGQQMYAKFEFEREKALNPSFAKFAEQTERLPESQQLELNGYLTKPTTRLARYPLLLDAILKRTEKDNPDYENIPKAISQIREFLFKVNEESGRAENRFSLHQLNQALTFRAGEYVPLNLLDSKRQLIFKGQLHKRPNPSEGNVQVYLFDHVILFAKKKKATGISSVASAAAAAAAAAIEPSSGDSPGGGEVLRVNSKPIPLELLQIAEGDEIGRRKAAASMIRSTVTRNTDDKLIFPITFEHLGKRGYEVTLYAENFQARKTWLEVILKQRDAQRAANDIYTNHTLYTSVTTGSGRVQSCAIFDGGKKLLFGFDKGIYLSNVDYLDAEGNFKPVCSTLKLIMQTQAPVMQLDAIEKYGVVVMLCDKVVSAIPLDVIVSKTDLNSHNNRNSIKQIANQVTFYKVDECLNRTLLTVVKSTNMSSTIRVFEPINSSGGTQKRPQLRRLLTAGGSSAQPDGFKMLNSPIEIPSATVSLSFLRSHLCLGCSRGFELLDLESGKFESLLDPADTSLDFVIKREWLRPISLYRIGKEFLLNYSDFSFFINRNGWRSRPDWIIQWECTPQNIVLSYPYLVAFDQNLIEIRNLDTELMRVIHADNVKLIRESAHDIVYSFENDKGKNEVVSLNFWEKAKKKKTEK